MSTKMNETGNKNERSDHKRNIIVKQMKKQSKSILNDGNISESSPQA